MSSEDKIDFEAINRLSVSIASHKVQLTKCENVEEMEKICKSIFDMEIEILMERKKKLRILQSKKEEILQKMAGLEADLDDINRDIHSQINRYRDAVTLRVTRLENEMNGKKGEMDTPSIDE